MQQRKPAFASIASSTKVCLIFGLWILVLLLNPLSAFANPDPDYETVSNVSFTRSEVHYNWFRGDLFTRNRIQNDSGATISGQFRLVVENPTLPVTNADGVTELGEPYLLLRQGRFFDFEPGATNRLHRRIYFENQPGAVDYALRLERKLPGLGVFETIPDIRYVKGNFPVNWFGHTIVIKHRVRNLGTETHQGPFRLVIENNNRPVNFPDGYTIAGEPYVLVENGAPITLAPDGLITNIRIRFRAWIWQFYGLEYDLRLEKIVPDPTMNQAPIAHAGVDQAADINDTVTLDGSQSSDADGDSLSFQWSLSSIPGASTATLSDTQVVSPNFVVDADGEYVVDLVVNDGTENSALDQVTISTINTRPVADAGRDQSAVAGDAVTLDGSASSDADGDPLTYFWEMDSAPGSSNSALDDATSVTPSITIDSTGEYVIRLTVDDGAKTSEPDSVIISNENLSPIANAGPDQLALISEVIQLDATASFDPESAGLSYRWSLVSAPTNSTASISDGTLLNPTVQIDLAGEYVIQLIVNDGELDSEPDQTIISTDNIRPLADAGADQNVLRDDLVQLDGSASSDAEPLTYSWALIASPAGSSASLDDATLVNPVFSADVVGTYIAQLIVDDGVFDSVPDTVVITVGAPPNQPPVINSIPVTTATAAELYTYDVDASDPENDTLTYELLIPPVSMSIDPGTGLITWTPTSAGSASVTVQVSDGQGGFATQSFNIDIAPANQIPVITSTPVIDAVTQSAYSYAVIASDPDGDPISFSLDQAPAGMSIDANGLIDWLPDTAGSFAVTVAVADNRGGVATQNFNIIVAQANRAPMIISTPITTATAESPYSYDVNATDLDGDPLTYALLNPPAGMAINNTGLISWLPTVEGSYPVAVQVDDGRGGLATQSFSIVVDPAPNLPPTITSTPIISADIDTDYMYQLVVDDPNGDSLSYSFSDKPLGMNVDGNGLISWTPVNDGSFDATIVVDDGRGGVDSQSFSVLVTGGAAQTPTLDALTDQIALLGTTLTLQLTASDPNNDQIEFFVAPLPLPANMTLDSFSGEFTFTPAANQVGDFVLKFMATDGRFYTEQTITITVPPPAGVTQLRGQVLTSGDAPLPGVRLEMGGVETLTDANGNFFLDNIPVSGNARLLVDGNVVDPALGSFATVPEMIPIIAGTLNLLEPAIFLLPLDVASADPVDPNQTSIVTSSRFVEGLKLTEPVTLTIPPDSAFDEFTGLPFVGDIHISRVTDPTKGPRPLPEEFDLSVYIAIQPFGVVYPNPVPISFPNVEEFPPDTRLDFFALNHETGVMEKIGEGLVSADGKTVDSIGGVVKSNSWHGIVPQGPVGTPDGTPDVNEPGGGTGGGNDGGGNDGIDDGVDDGVDDGADDGVDDVDDTDPDPDENTCPACEIDKETGNLKEWHKLPSYKSLQKTRSIRLEYNSNIAEPHPILPIVSGFGNRAPPPELMSMRINIDGIEMGREIFSEVKVEPSPIRGQFKTTRPVVQFNATMMQTGIYNYDLDIDCYFPISRRQGNVNGEIIIHNERDSVFGAGWTIAGLQRVFEHSSGKVMLIQGIATSLIFTPLDPTIDPNGFEAPPGEFSTLTRKVDGTLERRSKNGTRYVFDSQGLLVQRIDRNENITTYVYDAQQRLTRIIDPVGSAFVLDYVAGKISSISDPLNRITRFEHDSRGNLIAIIEPNGDRRTFEYEVDKNLMIAQTDQRLNRTEYQYNFAGRISEALLPDGSRPRFEVGQIKGLANPAPMGQEEDGSREFPIKAPLLEEEVNNRYIDHNGNEIMEETDKRHRALKVIDAVGRTYNYERDEDSNITRRIRPNTSLVDITFDDRGNRLTRFEQFNNASYQYSYDVFSLVTSYTNPNNHTTTYNRDTQGNLLTRVNHLGHTTTYEYDSRGLVTRVVTPNLLEVVYSYNIQGLVESITETPPAGSPGNVRVTQYSYDAAGQITQTITPDDVTLNMVYDSKGRLSNVSDNLGQSVEYTYDGYNNLIKTDTQNSDNSLALVVEKVFDNRNRYIESRLPHAGTEESVTKRILDNNSNLTTLTDPNGNSSSNRYDGEDRIIESTHRLNGITSYEFDTNNRLTKINAPNGVVTQYTYDVLGRRLEEVSPDRGTQVYTYDVNNNLLTRTDGRGITATFTYDELERPLTKTYPNSIAGKSEGVTYVYDNCPFGLGRLCQRSDESGTWDYEYDAFGNMVKETRVELGISYVTGYQYDDGDQIAQIAYPTGRTVEYSRDGVRRVEAISTDINGVSQDIVSGIEYRGDNKMTKYTFGNGLVDDRSYDLQGRLLSQTLGVIDSRDYSYDQNSNMLSRTATPQDSVYSYDALDRVIGDQINAGESFKYQYDLNHNRQSKTQTTDLADSYVYELNSNRLSRQDTFTEGILPATVSDRMYVYSDTNRIFRVIDNGLLSAEYLYNDSGQRTRKVAYDNTVTPVTTVTTVYHYDTTGYLIAETNELGIVIKDYIWNRGMAPVAQIDVANSIDIIHYLHTDHLKTPRFATTAIQQISWRWEGEAFGETADEIFSAEVNLRFPGQYYDRETGEHYNWNRYYRAGMGRYLTSDPVGLEGGLNTFGYVSGNPVRLIDPLGLRSACVENALKRVEACRAIADKADWLCTLSCKLIRINFLEEACTRNCQQVNQDAHVICSRLFDDLYEQCAKEEEENECRP